MKSFNPLSLFNKCFMPPIFLIMVLLLNFPNLAWSLSIANTGLHFQQGFDMYRFTVASSNMGEGEDGIRDFEIDMNLIRDGKVLETQTLQIEHFASSEADSRIDLYFEFDAPGNEPPDGNEPGPISFSISKATGKIDGKEIDFIKENDLYIEDFIPAKISIAPASRTASSQNLTSPKNTDSFGTQSVSGLVKEVKTKDEYSVGSFYLISQDGNEILLGDGNKIWDNLELRKCILFATNNGTPVTIIGDLINQDGKITFRNGDFTCSESPASTKYVSYEGCYGPRIGNFQLGISESDTKNIIGEYASKNNIRYSGTEKSLVTGDGKIFDVGFFGGKKAIKYQIGKQFFGVPNLQDKEFMQKFMHEYNIPEFSTSQYTDMFGHKGIKYVYSNPAEGYSISIFPNDILIESIKK